ncbi:MAG: hypothetical protein KF870_00795 [Leadbetterella sp.]|nr:hypothetical protein [Leadbetterella sp.]
MEKKLLIPLCNSYVSKYQTAITAYAASPTASNCLSLKSSLSDIVNKCTLITAQEKADYNAQINGLNCNN